MSVMYVVAWPDPPFKMERFMPQQLTSNVVDGLLFWGIISTEEGPLVKVTCPSGQIADSLKGLSSFKVPHSVRRVLIVTVPQFSFSFCPAFLHL